MRWFAGASTHMTETMWVRIVDSPRVLSRAQTSAVNSAGVNTFRPERRSRAANAASICCRNVRTVSVLGAQAESNITSAANTSRSTILTRGPSDNRTAYENRPG